MRIQNLLLFVIAALAFSLVAGYRFGDSVHAIGTISGSGGSVRHPVRISRQYSACTVIVTARVAGPYRGDARVVLEGKERISHKIFFSEPVIDLGIKRRPEFKNSILYDLEPGDSVAMWVILENITRIKENRYTLAFYDTKSGQSVLKVPVFLGLTGENDGDSGKCH